MERKDFRKNIWTHAYGDMWSREIAFVGDRPISYDIPLDPKAVKSERIYVNRVKSYALRHTNDITWNKQ